MAHLKKNTRGAVPGLAVHFERKTDHHTNKEIDVSKFYLNQDLMADGSDMLSRFNARLNDVYCMKRDDVKALATWIVNFTRRTRRSALRATERLFLKQPPIFLMNVMVKKMPWPLSCIMTKQPLTCTMPLSPLFLMIKNHVIKSPLKKFSHVMIYKPFMRI